MTMTRRQLLSLAAALPIRASSLQEQSAALALEHAFPDAATSYLLLNAMSGRVISARWPDPENPVPVGSLVKPFTAFAYGETHDFRFPAAICLGGESQCWLPSGHGRMEITSAIAHSCNAYFFGLAEAIAPQELTTLTRRFGLPAPDPASGPSTLIGLGGGWRMAPLTVARAYCELAAGSAEPGITALLAGMALSARSGTGRGVGPGAYAKTGTAPCIHGPSGGDGYTVALFPLDTPRYELLVRVHGVPGSHAAQVCGRMRTLVEPAA
jgi:hypothetical protein